MTVTITLTKPISAHGETVGALVLAEPETGDIIDIGTPFLIVPSAGGESAIEIRNKVVAAYVAKLARIPPSSVRALAPGDFSACTAAVLSFFGQAAG